MKKYLPHFVAWTIFISYEIIVIWYSTKALSGFEDYFYHYLLNICLFYGNALIVLPFCFKRFKKYRLVISLLFICLELTAFVILKYLIALVIGYLSSKQVVAYIENEQFIITTLFRGGYFIGFSTGYWLFRRTLVQRSEINILEQHKLKTDLENHRLEAELLHTQNDFLRSQINPHLLFNSLNFIHNVVVSINRKASEMIFRLTDTMRYALEPLGQGAMVELQQEIDNIQNYIELYRLKSDHKLHLEVSVKGDFNNLTISPVILLPLVENIFKYAELNEPGKKALLHIHCKDNILVLYIKNYKNTLTSKPGYGIGLSNVLTRLNKLYKGSHSIDIEENDDTYTLNLTLYLK